ncbi:hypothetical protein K2X33_11130 [bacterium]|nr:hypothetical protein [bacterium]
MAIWFLAAPAAQARIFGGRLQQRWGQPQGQRTQPPAVQSQPQPQVAESLRPDAPESFTQVEKVGDTYYTVSYERGAEGFYKRNVFARFENDAWNYLDEAASKKASDKSFETINRLENASGKSYSVSYERDEEGRIRRDVYARMDGKRWTYLEKQIEPKTDFDRVEQVYDKALTARLNMQAEVADKVTDNTRRMAQTNMAKDVARHLPTPTTTSLDGLMKQVVPAPQGSIAGFPVDAVDRPLTNTARPTIISFPGAGNAKQVTQAQIDFASAYRSEVLKGQMNSPTKVVGVVANLFSDDPGAGFSSITQKADLYKPTASVIIDATDVTKEYPKYVDGLKQVPSILAGAAVETAYKQDGRKASKGEDIATYGPGNFPIIRGIKANKYAEGLGKMVNGLLKASKDAKSYFDRAVDGVNKMFIVSVQENIYGGLKLIHHDVAKQGLPDYSVSVVWDKDKADAIRQKLNGAHALAAVPLADGGMYYLPIGGDIADDKTAKILRQIVDASQEGPVKRDTALAIEKSVLEGKELVELVPHATETKTAKTKPAETHAPNLWQRAGSFFSGGDTSTKPKEVTRRPPAKKYGK